MNLKIQFFCLFLSFIYGIVLFIIFQIHYHSYFLRKSKWKIVFQFFITVLSSFFYFIILNYLNNGILHYYFLLLIACGFLISYNFTKR